MDTNPRFKNYAFISYSRKDEREANWLHKALEGFRIPTGLPSLPDGAKAPKHVRPLFRDKTDLEVQPRSFVEQIERELAASRFLIVVCSPNAARSRPNGQHYVDWEIRQFIQAHGTDYAQVHILPVILAGDPGCGDPERECLPPALLELGPAFREHNFPLLKDLPEDRRGQAEAREQCVIGCVAFLLGVARTTIHDRHLRAQRERMRNYLALAAGVALALAGLTGWAVVERGRAEAERVRAETERNHAETARQVAESAKNDALVARDLAKTKQAEAEAEKKRADEQAQLAIQQRDRANAARVQAEGLVDSLTFQLRDRLNAAGNLSALREMNEAVERYHKTRDAAEQGKFDERTTEEMRRRAVSLVNQADLSVAQGDYEKAVQSLQEGLKAMWLLIAEDPANAPAHISDTVAGLQKLAAILEGCGQIAGAKKVHRGAIEMLQRLSAEIPDAASACQHGLYVGHMRLAYLELDDGATAAAETEFRAALAVAEKMQTAESGTVFWRENVASAQLSLGGVLQVTGRFSEAETLVRCSLATKQALLTAEPENAQLQLGVFHALGQMGDYLLSAGEQDPAISHYREALELIRQWTSKSPTDVTWQESLAEAQINLGRALASTGDTRQAESLFSQAADVLGVLVSKTPDKGALWQSLAAAYFEMAKLQFAQERAESCRDWAGKAEAVAEQHLATGDRPVVRALRADVLRLLVLANDKLGDHVAALQYSERLLPLSRLSGGGALLQDLVELVGLAGQAGAADKAMAAYAEAKTAAAALPSDMSREDRVETYSLLCWAALLAGVKTEALEYGQEAVALLAEEGPLPVRMNYAHAFLYGGRYAEAEAIYRSYLGQKFPDGRLWDDELRSDIAILRRAGRDHPDLKKVEAILQEPVSIPAGVATPR